MTAKSKKKSPAKKKSQTNKKVTSDLSIPINCIALTDVTEVRGFLNNLNSKEIITRLFEENFSFFRSLEKNSWDLIIIDSGIWSYLPKDSRKRFYDYIKSKRKTPPKTIYLETEKDLNENKMQKNLTYHDEKRIDESGLTTKKKFELLFNYILFWKLGEEPILQAVENLKNEIRSMALQKINPFIIKIENPFPLIAGESELNKTLEDQFETSRHSYKQLLISGMKGSLGNELAYLIHKWHQDYSRHCLEFDISIFSNPPLNVRDLRFGDVKTVIINKLENIAIEKLTAWRKFLSDCNPEKTKIIWVLETASIQQISRYKKVIVPDETIQIPPLSQRTFDIPSIIQVFLRQSIKDKEVEISNPVISNLLNQSWPANYAQLKNHVQTWILPYRKKIKLPDLPTFMISQDKGWGETIKALPFPADGISIEKIEKELLERALKETNYSISKAARLLAIGRKAFIYRMKKFGIVNKRETPAK